MIRKLLISAALPACIAFQAGMLPPAGFGQSVGGVVGVIRDSATGQPVTDAQILAHNINSGANYVGVSGPNGGLTIALPPGTYQITASKNGFSRSSSSVKVSSGKMSQFDILLAPLPVSTAQLANELAAMKARIDQLEGELKAKNAQEPELKAKSEQEPTPPQQEERPLLATATTDPSLLPRLPS